MPKSLPVRLIRGLTISASLCFATQVHADDVLESINEAVESYKKGAYSEAVNSLNYATQLIQQKKGDALAELFPPPLDGWEALEASSQVAGAAMLGGGLSAERQYTRGGSSVTIRVVADSPMLQGMMMLLTNPMFATSDGGKLERIAKQQALVKYDPANRSGDINLPVANRFLVTIEGSGVDREELKKYAEGIDYEKLSALP